MKPIVARCVVLLAQALLSGSFLILPLCLLPGAVQAQNGGRFEGYGTFQFLGGDTARYSGYAVGRRVEDLYMGGFGVGARLSPYMSLSVDLLFGSTDFVPDGPPTGLLPPEYFGDTSVAQMKFNGEVYFVDGPVTPFAKLGVGFASFTTYRYFVWGGSYDYQYWWGYETYDYEVHFCWGAAVGLRWDISDHVALRVAGGLDSIVMSGAREPLWLPMATLQIGVRF
jgi:hypothetical protein